MRVCCSMIVMVAANAVAFAANAHHSVAFYSNELLTVEGELVQVAWQNPHIKFVLRADGAGDNQKLWNIESSSIFLREQDSVTRDMFRVGDRVTIVGRRSPREESALLGLNVLLPNGREALLWPAQPPRFSSAGLVVKGDVGTVDSANDNKGIFRVWLPVLGGIRMQDCRSAKRQSRRGKLSMCSPLPEAASPKVCRVS